MGPATLALLLVGSGIAVHVEEVRGASPEETNEIVGIFRQALELRTGEKRVLTANVDTGECPIARRCLDAMLRAAAAHEVVFLRMIGTPEKLRIVADRASAPGHDGVQVQVDLERSKSGWNGQLDLLAAGLYPSERVLVPVHVATEEGFAPPAARLADPSVGPEPRSYLPWIVLGGSVVVAGVGAIFGARNLKASVEAGVAKSDAEYHALDKRVHDSGLAANILFGVAIAGVATSVFLFVTE